jgi:hypothetical protein
MTTRWKLGATLALLMAVAGAMAVYFALFNAPVAADDGVPVAEVRGRPVPGRPGHSEWVFVFPAPNGAQPAKGPPSTGGSCTDENSQTAYALFGKARAGGLTFNITAGSIPSYLGAGTATQAIQDSAAAWNAVSPGYYTVNTSGGATRPGQDGNNSIGFARLVPKTTLAAAWVYQDTVTGQVTESDVFYNNSYTWAALSGCNSASAVDLQNIGTHEIGHTAALDHVSDAGKQATMYPSAPKGEVRKRTLTTGDASGFSTSLAP